MDYYGFNFTFESSTPTDVINDVLASELGNIGFDSFISEVNGLLAYIAADRYNETSLINSLNDFPLPDIHFSYTRQLIKSRNWNEEWEKNYFQPVIIENDCLIHASFHPVMEGFKYPIVIDPKMAFGTGNHATTYLMLCELLKLDIHEKAFLDMGCGTAVFAILAAMKGASRVVAIDIDEWAFNNAIDNCRLNKVENVEVALGGAEQIARFGTFDYIFANINRNILLNDISHYAPALKPDGSLFMSGFYKEDMHVIEEESNRNGLSINAFSERDNWVAIQVKKITGKNLFF